MELLKWVHNTKSREVDYKKSELIGFDEKSMHDVYEFHKSFLVLWFPKIVIFLLLNICLGYKCRFNAFFCFF